VAVDLFQRMEKLGELDNLPALAAVPFFEKPLSARLRSRATAGGAPVRKLPYRAEYLASIKLEAMRQMEQQGLAGDRLQRYLQWLGRVEAVALETGPGSAERDQRIDDLVKSTSDSALSRRVADLYVAVFERWRPRLFK
jgi:hypothetical protein